MKNERRQQILEVAKRLFLHHGFQKVTLGDIAAESGVSRPTVYQAFANKEEIFNAIIQSYQEASLLRIQELHDTGHSMREKIESAIEIWVVETFEIIHASPGAEELIDCTFGFASETTDAGYLAFEKEVAAILDGAGFAGQLPNRDLAQYMVVSLRGFKSQARDIKELRNWIHNLLVLALGES